MLYADEVAKSNGDIVKGEIQAKTKDELILRAEDGGLKKIKLKNVVHIKDTEPKKKPKGDNDKLLDGFRELKKICTQDRVNSRDLRNYMSYLASYGFVAGTIAYRRYKTAHNSKHQEALIMVMGRCGDRRIVKLANETIIPLGLNRNASNAKRSQAMQLYRELMKLYDNACDGMQWTIKNGKLVQREMAR
jgi:hypothetical protein